MLKISRLASPLFLVALAAVTPALAYETDQLTGRSQSVPDCSSEVDAYVNAFLRKAAARVEKKAKASWSDARIAEELRDSVADENPFNMRYFGARIEIWMRFDLAARGFAVKNEGSIYSDYRRIFGLGGRPRMYPSPFVFTIASRVSGEIVSETFEAGGVRFGGDKLSHFFRLGYRYWKRSKGGSDEAAGIAYGTSTENGFLGYGSIGVFSFADLAANHDGYRFFKNLAAPASAGPDETEFAHFTFYRDTDKKLHVELKRPFRITEYATDDWDEVLNPSIYRPELLHVITQRLASRRAEVCAEYALWQDGPHGHARFPLNDRASYTDFTQVPDAHGGDPFALTALCPEESFVH